MMTTTTTRPCTSCNDASCVLCDDAGRVPVLNASDLDPEQFAVEALKLEEGAEIEDAEGRIWTRFGHEFKVSPRGKVGDFDTGCFWLDRSELRE